MCLLALFFVGFLFVHLFKMTRLYLVLMEHKIPLSRFIILYIKTTLINFVIPFKLGEIYRFFCVSRETKHWQVGILSILVDRFFDILALCVILVPCDLYVSKISKVTFVNHNSYIGGLSIVTWIFIVLLALISLLYITIEPSYYYLNHYLIKEKSSKRSLSALHLLDIIKRWYDFTKDLVNGRFALIFLSSIVGWFFEVFTLKALSSFMGDRFGVDAFVDYIQSIFSVYSSKLSYRYSVYSVVILVVILVLCLIIQLVKRISKSRAI